jgi:6-phosphogluconolactonase (cycloisomerase 2 family)
MIASEPSGKYVYTANQGSADVSGFALNASTGVLTALPGSPYLSGPVPVALVIDHAGKFVYVANSAAPSISGFSINPSTGDLTPVPGSPFAADFFPRTFAIDPLGKFLYVGIASSFMGDSTEVMAFSIGSSGALTPVPGSPFTAGRNPLAVATDAAGKFLYVGNTDDHTLSSFAIDAASGALSPLSGSPYPLPGYVFSATVDATGKFLYLSGLGVMGFSIDTVTGGLTPIAGSPFPAGVNVLSVTTVKTK